MLIQGHSLSLQDDALSTGILRAESRPQWQRKTLPPEAANERHLHQCMPEETLASLTVMQAKNSKK